MFCIILYNKKSGESFLRALSGTEVPLYESMTVEGDRTYLTFRTGQSSLAPFGRWLTRFEVAGANRIFYPAKARNDRDKRCVVVTSSSVTAQVAVRYGLRKVIIHKYDVILFLSSW